MRLLIFLGIGLVAGLGLGTGGYMMWPRAESEEAADAEVAAADTAHAEDTANVETPAEPPDEGGGLVSGLFTERLSSGPSPEDSTSSMVAEETEPDQGHDDADAEGQPEETPPEEVEPTEGSPPEPEPTTEVPVPAAESSPEVEEAGKRLARIFGAMQPRDAAKVMNRLSQDELELVARHLSNRSAAQILASLDAERAAELSRLLIKPEEARQ